jgi:peptide/nickel transport system ATP-binding protein
VSADVESPTPASDHPVTRRGSRVEVPPLVVEGVTKAYRGRRRERVVAVDDVSLTIAPGAAVSLVGASGSGKSTIAKMITGLERPTSGSVRFGDLEVGKLSRRSLREYHHRVQMVFQDPYGALNPLHTVEYTLARPCVNFLGMSAREAKQRVDELLETVGLTPPDQFAPKLPHQLSGGQRQRVVIARALACEPSLIVADEPVSMLDVSLRAGVLKLLANLRLERGLSLLYITHDLLSARVVSDEILVLHRGRIVERGVTKDVLQHPEDDYTVQLINAIANPYAPPHSTASSAAGAAGDV